MEVWSLYRQKQERRQQNLPVELDRRSGVDRRLSPRINASLQDDIHKFDWVKDFNTSKTDNKKSTFGAFLSTIPYLRRILGIQDAHIAHKTTKEAGKILVMLVNVKEDWRDMSNAFKQFIGKVKVTPEDAAFQSEFSFFRGTCFEYLLKKLGKTGEKISKFDKTLYDTKLGIIFLKFIGRQSHKIKKTKRKNVFGIQGKEIKIEGSLISKILGRAMLRTPVIGLLFLFALEIPSVYSAFTSKNDIKSNIKEGFKQIIKSFNSVSIMTAGAGILGGILASKKGHIGSLAGIGFGTYYGTEAANKINKEIDKI